MQTNVFQLTGIDQCIRVHGFEDAKSYSMGANCRVPLFDDTDDLLYVKSTDQNGFPTIRRYRLVEEVIVDTNNSGNGIPLNDIRSMIRDEISMMKEELLNAQQSVSTTSNNQCTNDTREFSSTSGGKHHGNKQQRSNNSNVEHGESQQ